MGACCVSDASREEKLSNIQKSQELAKQRENDRKNKKVVIIGAGPAGVHMYSLLIKAGWNNDNILILEKTSRTAGKSYTIQDNNDGNDIAQQVVHEMGTCYCHPDYHAIFDLFEEYDPSNKLKGVPSRAVFGTSLNEKISSRDGTAEEQEAVSFTKWVMNEAEKLTVPKEFHFLHDAITGGISWLESIQRYNAIHRKIFGKQKNNKRHGFLNKPNEEDMKRIDCTFLQFIQQEKLEALIPFFVYAQSVQGYGTLDKVPAYYGLFWNTPELMSYAGDLFRMIQNKPNVFIATKGFQHLWRSMITKHKMNITINAEIKSINRYLDNNDKATKIRYCIRNDDENNDVKSDEKEMEIECDYLFLACGCQKALSFLTDATSEEKQVFTPIKSHTFCSTLYESDTHKENLNETVVEIWPKIIWKANGNLFAHRNSIKCLLDHEEYDKKVKNGSITKDRGVAYQFLNREPDKNKKNDETFFGEILNEDLKLWGEQNVKFIYQRVWDYFPIWDQESINKGYPWKVKEEMQSKYKNTFYIGSSVCFESVLNVVEYNNELFDTFKF